MATLKTQYAILGLLKMHGAASGYQLRKVMSESTEYFWSEAFGSIYPTFRKLEDQGLVTRSESKSSGKPTSIIYNITPQGEEVLSQWLQLQPEDQKPRNELLLKIFFSHHQPVAHVRHLIKTKLSEKKDKLAVFQLVNEQLLKEESNSPELPYWLMTLRHGIIHAKATIDWCNECLKGLDKEK